MRKKKVLLLPMAPVLQLWFAKVLRDGLALAASGAFAPFKDIGSYHLRSMLSSAGVSGDHTSAVQSILEGFNEATCMPDVGPAFQKLHAAGIKVIQVLLTGTSQHCTACTWTN